MNAEEIEEAVKEVMGKDPIEVCTNYYKGIIRLSRDRIAEEEKTIRKMEKRIVELEGLSDE